jgi:hypothetical protein
VHGYDAESKKLKKTLVRHCNLMGVLLVRSLSRTNNNCKKILEEAVKLGWFIFAFFIEHRLNFSLFLQDL